MQTLCSTLRYLSYEHLFATVKEMEQTERNRIVGNITQRRKSIASSYQRNAPVTLDRDTMLDLLALVVELEHGQRGT
jgi:hypothetical protein